VEVHAKDNDIVTVELEVEEEGSPVVDVTVMFENKPVLGTYIDMTPIFGQEVAVYDKEEPDEDKPSGNSKG